jgi:hypothetical protein
LAAVRQGPAPPPGSDGRTFIDVALRATGVVAEVWVGDRRLPIDGSQVRVSLPDPVLGEDSAVSVYLTGPIPSSLATEPRADSARELFSRRGFQHYQIRYKGAVGDVLWRWDTPVGSVSISLECFPTKLDYRTDFDSIRAALEELAPSLTASAGGAAARSFTTTRQRAQAAEVEWLQMVRRHYADLQAAVDRLLPSLRRQIQPQQTVSTRDRMRRAKPVSKRGYGPGRPTAAIQVSTLVDAEATPINGHLKWELERLRATTLAATGAKWFANLDSNLKAPVSELATDVADWLRQLQHLPTVMHLPNLQVRLRDPLYESAFRSLHTLRLALQPLEHAYPIGLKDLPTLYEYWVFLRVVQLLEGRYPIVKRRSQPLVQRAGADLVLTPGRASEIVLADLSGREVACQFNRLFTGLPTTNQRPDAVIAIRGGDRLLLIDAKYRLGRDPNYIRRYGYQGPLADDINVIHRYRDAIVATLPPHRRLSHAGLIAFPGRESPRYVNHQFYRSWLSVRVGGMPMLPSGSGFMEQAINDYMDEMATEDTA